MRHLTIIALAGALAAPLAGCPDPKVPDPPVDPDGGTATTCDAVCAHWSDLGCEEAKPTPDGASCVEVCENLQEGNLKDDLECQAAVTSCEQIDDC